MIKRVNYCVGCPDGIGCLGRSCPYCQVLVIECDVCGQELADGEIYKDGSEILCEDCLKERFYVSESSVRDDYDASDEDDY